MTFFIKKIRLSKSGFSFLELMVVIAIIGVLSVITIPSFIATKNDRMLKNAARNLLSDMHRTRMGAIKDNQQWSINFTFGSGIPADPINIQFDGYNITDAVGAVRKTVTFFDKLSGVTYNNGLARVDIPQAVFPTPPLNADVVTYGATLTFNARGTCNAGYAYLTNTKGTTFGIGTLTSGIVIFKQWMGSTATGNWSD